MTLLTVMLKEIVDNLRDKQTVFYALLFGPLLLPLVIGGSLVASFKQLSIDLDEVHSLAVINSELAPNLVQFLRANNLDVEAAPDDMVASVRRGDTLVVLEIPEAFADSLRQAQPAPLTLYVNNANRESSKAAMRVSTVLQRYEHSINALRLQHRGIDPSIFNALDIQREDVSDDGADGQLLSSLLPFLFILSMIMGGNYLAVDTTAGERERQSLEPLLSLPLPRTYIVLGKYAATLCFVTLSALLTAISIYMLFRLFPVELMGGQIQFDGQTLTKAFALVSPLLFFMAAMLITVAAITRSTKQAQTYLGLMMVVPMAPYFIMQFINLKSSGFSMSVPMLSQYQLLEGVVLGDVIPVTHIVLSTAGTLLCTVLLLHFAIRLYQREKILDQ